MSDQQREIEQLASNAYYGAFRNAAAERDRYRVALEEIAVKTLYGCCKPMYPDSPVCAHNIARRALSPNPSETRAE